MQVACPNCSTRYNIPDAALAAGGQKLKCAVCSETWMVEPEDPFSDLEDPFNPADEVDETEALSDSFDESVEADAQSSELDDDPFNSVSAVDPDDISFDDGETPPFVTDDLADTVDPIPFDKKRKITIKRKRMDKRPLMIAAAVVLAMFIGTLISYRDSIVSVYPQSAGVFAFIGMPVNLRGLVFADIATERGIESGVDVLNISGEIVNIEDEPTILPALRFTMRDARDKEIYSWQSRLPQEFLRPGETISFESQVVTPPPQGQSIKIFFTDASNPIASAGTPSSGS